MSHKYLLHRYLVVVSHISWRQACLYKRRSWQFTLLHPASAAARAPHALHLAFLQLTTRWGEGSLPSLLPTLLPFHNQHWKAGCGWTAFGTQIQNGSPTERCCDIHGCWVYIFLRLATEVNRCSNCCLTCDLNVDFEQKIYNVESQIGDSNSNPSHTEQVT